MALKWAEDVEKKLDMDCTIIEGEAEVSRQLDEALARESADAAQPAAKARAAPKKK